MQKSEAAAYLAGAKQVEGAEASAPTNLHVISGEVIEKSEEGKVKVDLGGLVFSEDDEQAIEIDTLGGLEVGDTATILLAGQENRGMTPLGIGGVGTTDRVVKKIEGIEADYVKATLLEAQVAQIGFLKADSATITNLQAETAKIQNLTAEQLSAATAYIAALTAGSITAESLTADVAKVHNLTADQLSAAAGYISQLTADSVTAQNISAMYGDFATVKANAAKVANLTAQELEADHATIASLDSNYAHITNGVIDNAKIGYADVNNLSAHYAEIQNGHINSALIDTAAIVDEQVFTVTGNKATIASIDASKINVTNLNADNITVNKINGQPVTGKSISDALSQHDSDISTLKTDTGELKIQTQNLETSLGDKVDVTTFNELSSDVSENSASITTLSNTVSQKADSSTVTTLSNTVNTVQQTATGNSTKISQLTQTLGTNADGTTKTNDIVHRTSAVEQDLSGFKTTVSSTYATKTALGQETTARQTAINQLDSEIALRAKKMETIDGNMLYDVDAPSLVKIFGPANRYFSDSGNASFMVCDIRAVTNSPATGIEYMAHWSVSGSSANKQRGLCFYNGNHTQFVTGQKYILSCWVRCTSGKFTYCNNAYATAFPANSGARTIDSSVDSGWQFVTTTVTATKTQLDRVYFMAKTLSDSLTFECDMCGFKMVPAAYATQAELKVANDEIAARVEKNGVISAINLSGETAKIQASRVEIDGTAVFKAAKSKLDAAYDAKGAAATAETNAKTYADGLPSYKVISNTSYHYSTANWLKYSEEGSSWGWTAITGVKVGDMLLVHGINDDTSSDVYCLITVTELTSSGAVKKATSHGLIDQEAGKRADAAQSSVDNLQIGGRNLLYGDVGRIGRWTVDTPSGANFVKTESNDGYRVSIAFNSVSGYENLNAPTGVSVTVGETYTLSCHYVVGKQFTETSGRGGYGVTIRTDNGSHGSYDTSSNSLGKVKFSTAVGTYIGSCTFEATVDTIYLCMNGGQIADYQTGLSFEVYDLKLEKGNKATDWTPAPEDQEAATLASGIEYIEGTQTAATNLWTGVTKETTLVEGKTIAYKLPYNGTSSAATLNLTLAGGGTTGAKAVQMLYSTSSNTGAWTNLTTHWPAGSIIPMTYDGTKWCVQNYNTNVDDKNARNVRFYNTIIAGEALSGESIIGMHADGKFYQVKEHAFFLLSAPLLWTDAAVASGKTNVSNIWTHMYDRNLATFYTSFVNTTKNCTVYLVGTVNGNTFSTYGNSSASYLTVTEPASEDGLFYIPIGRLGNDSTGKNRFNYFVDYPVSLYAYLDGKFRQVTPTEIVGEQYIYKSASIGTISMAKNETWATDNTGAQNTWTTVRPEYDREYPVVFVAKQAKRLDTTVTCTTPKIDMTTTIIDGANIITGSITADSINSTDLHVKAANIDGTVTVGLSDVEGLDRRLKGIDETLKGISEESTARAEWVKIDSSGVEVGNNGTGTKVSAGIVDFSVNGNTVASAGVDGFDADRMNTDQLTVGGDWAITVSGGMFSIDYIGA